MYLMKTDICLNIHTVWSVPSFSAWRNFASLGVQNAPSEDSDQTVRCAVWSESSLVAYILESMFSDSLLYFIVWYVQSNREQFTVQTFKSDPRLSLSTLDILKREISDRFTMQNRIKFHFNWLVSGEKWHWHFCWCFYVAIICSVVAYEHHFLYETNQHTRESARLARDFTVTRI